MCQRRSFHRVMEELKESRLLPQEESKTYTLLQFRETLTTMNQERLHALEKLQKYRAVILSVVPYIFFFLHCKNSTTALNLAVFMKQFKVQGFNSSYQT